MNFSIEQREDAKAALRMFAKPEALTDDYVRGFCAGQIDSIAVIGELEWTEENGAHVLDCYRLFCSEMLAIRDELLAEDTQ